MYLLDTMRGKQGAICNFSELIVSLKVLIVSVVFPSAVLIGVNSHVVFLNSRYCWIKH